MVVAIIGIVVVGGRLARAWPRDVDVAYRAASEVTALDVDIVLDGEAVKSARFFRTARDQKDFFHTVTLPPGEYEARITVFGPEGEGVEYLRVLSVPTAGITRFDIRD